MQGYLLLEDGALFEGRGFGHRGTRFGEAVFTTAMVGYQEILTDPSYAGQIVAQTFPHIGNYGVNPEDMESRRPALEGYLVQDLTAAPSSWRGTASWLTCSRRSLWPRPWPPDRAAPHCGRHRSGDYGRVADLPRRRCCAGTACPAKERFNRGACP